MELQEVVVLVLSSDGYEDCWEIFYKCFKKYWGDCPYPIYLLTQTKPYKEIQTICINESVWSTRVKKALESIKCDYVIILLEDFFIRNKVDQERINYCIKSFMKETAFFDFELEYSLNQATGNYTKSFPSNKECIYDGFKERPSGIPYLHTCQPGIWSREKLIKELEEPLNPWEWEMKVVETEDKYYINSSKKLIIDIGFYNLNKFSLSRGKWTLEVIEFLNKEGIDVNYNVRGIYIGG